MGYNCIDIDEDKVIAMLHSRPNSLNVGGPSTIY